MLSANEARPPYVTFETRPIEDRNASIEAGHYVAKDVIYALITPQGSRDRVEQEADAWLDMLAKESREGRFPQEWLTAYKSIYSEWKEGREMPLSGTSITLWPALKPSLIPTLLDIKILTVEDLANANEETVNRIGMGGRALKQQAKDWLEASSSVGTVAAKVTALSSENSDLQERNKELLNRLELAESRLQALEAPSQLHKKL